MKKKTFLFLWMSVTLLFTGDICLAQIPHGVSGFILGKNISEYKKIINGETALPIRYMEYLREVEIIKTEDFKSGLIWYGTCLNPGQIVRIKLKYADSTKKFYDKLFERFKKRFGKPSEWRGDPFHIIIAWKWNFTDTENNHISLILQHNTKDEEEKIGNVVKLTMWNLIEAESLCFEKKENQQTERALKGIDEDLGSVPLHWDRLIPR